MRKRELARVEEVLKGFKPKQLAPLVRGIEADLAGAAAPKPDGVTLSAYLSATSLRLFQRIDDHLAPARKRDNVETRHALRIAVKKRRYFLEIVARMVGREYEAELEHLKDYQSILGRMNDMVEFPAVCHRLELDPAERQAVEDALRREERLLWRRFLELMRKQPLQCSFPSPPTAAGKTDGPPSPATGRSSSTRPSPR
jgi:CHAD domain-containing protein